MSISTTPTTSPTPAAGGTGISHHATSDIIEALEAGSFPNRLMLTLHPQRWTDNKFLMAKKYIAQNLKNQVKRVLVNNLT